MQYQVPQFIEVEDKIFGPLTFRQFVYLAGGGGACLALYTLLPLWLALPLMIPFVGLAAALAFYKVNGRPFILAMEHAFSYFLGSKLYLWQQREAKAMADNKEQKTQAQALQSVPKLSESKLRDLAWSLNIKDPLQESIQNRESGKFAI